MGLYDTIKIEDDIGELNVEEEWQSKTIRQNPGLEVYKIENSRLFKEDADYNFVPKEERPYYDHEDFEDNPILQICGMTDKERTGWKDTEYHGTFEIHTSVEDESIRYEIKFTDGEMDSLMRVD